MTAERFIGLHNLGVTCYANSVLQVLFRLSPLRPSLVQWAMLYKNRPPPSSADERLLLAASQLFSNMQTHETRTGTLEPADLLSAVRRMHEGFRERRQQDAHEFYSWLINALAEAIQALQKRSMPGDPFAELVLRRWDDTSGATFVHATVEGMLESNVTCRGCGTISSRQEAFVDLSLDVPRDGCSVQYCLNHLGSPETLDGFHCETPTCGGTLQTAERRLQVVRVPPVLVLHLKRFQYQSQVRGYVKLLHRVSFSLQLRDPVNAALYRLCGVVIHSGQIESGHYISCVLVEGKWFLFNDESVRIISASQLSQFFGGSACAYLLFYERV